MDDLKNPGPEDGKLVALGEEHELDFWTKTLGVTRDELRALVAKYGHSAAAIREGMEHPDG